MYVCSSAMHDAQAWCADLLYELDWQHCRKCSKRGSKHLRRRLEEGLPGAWPDVPFLFLLCGLCGGVRAMALLHQAGQRFM